MAEIQVSRPMELEHAFNVRDLGVYCNKEGKQLKKHRFLRSDSLGHLTEEEWKILSDYGVKEIVDLRSPQESEKEPYDLAETVGIHYDPVPLFDDIQSNDGTQAFPKSLHDLYTMLLDYCSGQFAVAMRNFLKVEDGCCLFNCTAGKDRTGLTAMLLLGLADVDDEIIIADYSVSADNMMPVFGEQIKAMEAAGQEKFTFLLKSEPENMRLTLEYIKEHYGSVRQYLCKILSEEEVEKLRKMLVD